MRLSRVERLMLSNQYRVLEALYPNERDGFANTRAAIESGFEIEYDWQTSHIRKDVVTMQECEEVIDILSMFEALRLAYSKMDDKSGLEEFNIKFAGFDGNNETKQLIYTAYLQKNDKFVDLSGLDGLNSHAPVLAGYRRMLSEWQQSDNPYSLRKEDVLRIASARNISSFIEQNNISNGDDKLDELREMIYQARGRSEIENKPAS